MGARGETLAKQLEVKVQEATAVFERLSDADWKKVTAAEKWSVGVTAHHIAVAHEIIGGLIKGLAEGKPGPNIHAEENAGCTRAETIALHKKTAAAAAAMVRGLPDDQMDRSGSVLAGAPATLGSIRATVGA